jgi:hypothetical protein
MGKIALEQLLDSLDEFWEKNDVPLLSILGPGIDIDRIEPRNFNGVLPKDLKTLYRWRNGVKPEFAAELIGRLMLFKGGIPMTIEEIWWVQDTMGGDNTGWSKSNIPIFESGGGDFYLLNCDDKTSDYGQIIYFSPVAVEFEKSISVYDSLITLFQTTYECYKSGIYKFDDQQMMVVDHAQLKKVAHHLNPESKYWRLFK